MVGTPDDVKLFQQYADNRVTVRDRITGDNAVSQTVEANLLLSILLELKKIRSVLTEIDESLNPR
jgi:hypothetical protein